MAKVRASQIWWEREEGAGKRQAVIFVRLRALTPIGETHRVTQAHRSSSGIFCFRNEDDGRGRKHLIFHPMGGKSAQSKEVPAQELGKLRCPLCHLRKGAFM